jgi:hypothetical protein
LAAAFVDEKPENMKKRTEVREAAMIVWLADSLWPPILVTRTKRSEFLRQLTFADIFVFVRFFYFCTQLAVLHNC